jgi:DNA-directed RNA polymerase subunit M/transcription elongation factor TFIIS
MPRLARCPKCRNAMTGRNGVWSSIKYKSLECPNCRFLIESTSRDAAVKEWNQAQPGAEAVSHATDTNDGDRAFPGHHWAEPDPLTGGSRQKWEEGMSLRDWFAGQVGGNLANHWAETGHTWGEIAEAAYSLADAMLVEREKTK